MFKAHTLGKNNIVFSIQSSLSYFYSQYCDLINRNSSKVFSLHLFWFSFLFNAYAFIDFLYYFFSFLLFLGSSEYLKSSFVYPVFDNLFYLTQPSIMTWFSCFSHTHCSLHNGGFYSVLSLPCHSSPNWSYQGSGVLYPGVGLEL